tara:strand:- start:327 stop:494 length:168 start_codon:yes stop_codon:yes gene_type:complete
MSEDEQRIFNFCKIQLQIMTDREEKLRKEILDCKIQTEFLTSIIESIVKKNPGGS